MNLRELIAQYVAQLQERTASGVLSFDEIRSRIDRAVTAEAGIGNPPREGDWARMPYVLEVFPGFFIYREGSAAVPEGSSGYLKREYALVDGKVTLGEEKAAVEQAWVEVNTEAWKQAREQAAEQHITAPADAQVLTEAAELSGISFCTEADGTPVIQNALLLVPGISINKNEHFAEVIQRDGPSVFEGAPAFITNHRPEQKNVNSLAGYYKNVRWTAEGLRGDLRGFKSDPTTLARVYEAATALGGERVGLSIDTPAQMVPKGTGGGVVREVRRYYRSSQTSIDIVLNPSAGGRLSEATEGDNTVNLRERLALLNAGILAGMTRDALVAYLDGAAEVNEALVREANPTVAEAILAKLNPAPPAQNPPADRAQEGAQGGTPLLSAAELADLRAQVARELRAEMTPAIRDTVLEATRAGANADLLERRLQAEQRVIGNIGAELVRREFAERVAEADFASALDTRLAAVRDEVGRSFPNRPSVPAGDLTVREALDLNIERLYATCLSGQARYEHEFNGRRVQPFGRISQALFAFDPSFAREWVDNEEYAAQEALRYFQWGGGPMDRYLSTVSEASLGSDQFTYAWLNVLNRVLARQVQDPMLNLWRPLVSDFISFNDLTNGYRFVRVGELGAAPKVEERGTYQYGTRPGEERQDIGIEKRGILHPITWEAILRDDIGVLARIPRDLGRSYQWTVHDVIWGLFQANSGNGQTMTQDGLPLYDAAHGNTATLPFSVSNLETVRQKLPRQTDMSSGRRKAYRARFLAYASPELDQSIWEAVESVYKITAAASEVNLPNYIRNVLRLEPIPVFYPTATTTRWELIGDPNDSQTIAVGYLNGRDTPDIFVQDQETVGTRFQSDEIVYKMRFTIGAAIVDYRPFSRGNV